MNRETTNLKKEEIVRKWYVVDAANKPLGRLASEVATHLMGKQKPSWTPNQDCGDYIIVINCEKVSVSGNNVMTNKKYYNVSGYNGGMRVRTLKEMLELFYNAYIRFQNFLNENRDIIVAFLELKSEDTFDTF